MSNTRRTILAAAALSTAVVALGAGPAADVVNQLPCGLRPQGTASSVDCINGTSARRVLHCSATTTAMGAFICSVPLPSGGLPGPAPGHVPRAVVGASRSSR